MQNDEDFDGIEGDQWASADTGIAIGIAIELWHRGEETPEAMVEALARVEKSAEKGFEDRGGGKPYPRADFAAISRICERYSGDKRNVGAVIPELQEVHVAVELPLPDGSSWWISGHPDQVRRRDDGVLEVWDLKCSKFEPRELVAMSALQLCAYAKALTAKLGEPVGLGGIIALRQYTTRPAMKLPPEEVNVQHRLYWKMADCDAALSTVGANIVRARMGSHPMSLGAHCSFCPASVPKGSAPTYPTRGFAVCRQNFGV